MLPTATTAIIVIVMRSIKGLRCWLALAPSYLKLFIMRGGATAAAADRPPAQQSEYATLFSSNAPILICVRLCTPHVAVTGSNACNLLSPFAHCLVFLFADDFLQHAPAGM